MANWAGVLRAGVKQALMVSATVALLTSPYVCFGQPGERVVKPEIRVGDSWTYRSRTIIRKDTQVSEIRVTFVDENVILTVATRKSDGKEIDASWTPSWSPVVSDRGMIYRYPQSERDSQFPMQIGDARPFRFEMVRPNSGTTVLRAKGTRTVIGWEDVEVPAGRFRAMKVLSDGEYLPADGSSSYKQRNTLWYSPEVRRWVKREVSVAKGGYVEELVSYKLNED